MPRKVTGTNGGEDDVERIRKAIQQEDSVPEAEVILEGIFDFRDAGTILLRNGIKVTGGQEATIKGGQIPLDVQLDPQKPVRAVTIQGVRFVNPTQLAIRVQGVTNLMITRCRIEKVTPVPSYDPKTQEWQFNNAGGIVVSSGVSGDISIVDNPMIDVGGGPTDRTFGIMVNRGNQGGAASILVAGNTVMNTTAHGIDLRDVNGSDTERVPPTPIVVQATVERNTITTGAVGGKQVNGLDSFVNGIRCLGSGQYLVTGNVIDCGFENSAGIRLQSNSSTVPVTGATVGGRTADDGNVITMSAKIVSNRGSLTESAGIELRRNCKGNMVWNNRILGSARTALCLIAEAAPVAPPTPVGPVLIPKDNNFDENDHANLNSFAADIIVGKSVTNTRIKGGTGGSIIDNESIGTTVEPEGNYGQLYAGAVVRL